MKYLLRKNYLKIITYTLNNINLFVKEKNWENIIIIISWILIKTKNVFVLQLRVFFVYVITFSGSNYSLKVSSSSSINQK